MVLGPIFFCLPAALAFAQDTNSPPISVPVNASPGYLIHTDFPVYHPPEVKGGILPVRVGGSSRGAATGGMIVEALAPDQLALTTRSQPTLYWYQSKDAKTRCELTLMEPPKTRLLLTLQSSGPAQAGLHAVKLSAFHVKLVPHVVYEWSVAILVDPQDRSEDILADGIIEYAEPSPELAGKIAAATDADRAAVYANAGIWYDALDAVSARINASPADRHLHDQRVALLNQIGLDGAAIEETALLR
jgi:hypothetical protein